MQADDIEFLDDSSSSKSSSSSSKSSSSSSNSIITPKDLKYFFILVLGLYAIDLWIRSGDMFLTKYVPQEHLMDWRVMLIMAIIGTAIFLYLVRIHGATYSIFGLDGSS